MLFLTKSGAVRCWVGSCFCHCRNLQRNYLVCARDLLGLRPKIKDRAVEKCRNRTQILGCRTSDRQKDPNLVIGHPHPHVISGPQFVTLRAGLFSRVSAGEQSTTELWFHYFANFPNYYSQWRSVCPFKKIRSTIPNDDEPWRCILVIMDAAGRSVSTLLPACRHPHTTPFQ